jgi:hypothetical protein
MGVSYRTLWAATIITAATGAAAGFFHPAGTEAEVIEPVFVLDRDDRIFPALKDKPGIYKNFPK